MTVSSDLFEKQVAYFVNEIPHLKACRPKVGPQYSDVKVECQKTGKSTWMEVKMNHTDNLGNPRMYFDGTKWASNYETPIAYHAIDLLNKSEMAKDFISDLSKFSGIDNVHVPTTIGGLKREGAVPLDVMNEFFEQTGRNKYLGEDINIDVGNLMKKHYLEGKKEAAAYLQSGDSCYIIDYENPLDMHHEVPIIEGTGNFKVRMSCRSKFYEILVEMKMNEMVHSDFSILPYTDKRNPWSNYYD